MRTSLKVVIPGLAASMLLAACGGGGYGTPASSPSTTPHGSAQSGGGAGGLVKIASAAGIGTVLVNAQGMTLYHLSAEHSGRFICTSACLRLWHPLTTPAGRAPHGAVSALATIKRPDGSLQVTYKGSPLYTFAHDQQIGEARGRGRKDVGTWEAATTSASPPQPASAAPSGSSGY